MGKRKNMKFPPENRFGMILMTYENDGYEDDLDEQFDVWMYQCPKCKRLFATADIFLDHLQDIHNHKNKIPNITIDILNNFKKHFVTTARQYLAKTKIVTPQTDFYNSTNLEIYSKRKVMEEVQKNIEVNRNKTTEQKDESYKDTPEFLCKLEYWEYLATPHWKRVRTRILRRAKNRCEQCGATHLRIDIHHLTYKNKGCEKDEDLIALCAECHSKIHGKKFDYEKYKGAR